MAEENIIVVDVGSSSVKAGFSGEDIPSYVFPSITALPPARSIEVRMMLSSNECERIDNCCAT